MEGVEVSVGIEFGEGEEGGGGLLKDERKKKKSKI
jgi:hypothetical protein